MSDLTRLAIENVSKKYCYSLKRSLWYGVKDITSEIFGQNRQDRLREQEFWALRNLNFSVDQGESVGLIGSNGAGKSTLLKLINGLIKPDNGQIRVRGNVGALIELGVGFNPVLTGRENIYVNSAVLGFTKKEVDSILDEIIDFSEIEEFIDTPVKFYSSGMKVRLGFSVAAQLRPELLLVDEVLSVGDFAFRNKCLTKLNELKNDGVAFILVSHNQTHIIQFCERAIWLDKAEIAMDGEPVTVCSKYLSKLGSGPANQSLFGDSVKNEQAVLSSDVQVCDLETGVPIKEIPMGGRFKITFDFETKSSLTSPNISFPIYREDGLLLTTVATLGRNINLERKDGCYSGSVIVGPVGFVPGSYTMVANLHDGMEYLQRTPVASFQVYSSNASTTWGVLHLEQKWTTASTKGIETE